MQHEPRDQELVGVARDAATLADVLGALETRGFRSQLIARPGARIECARCHRRFAAAEARLHELRRLEGASDPADMLAVAALTCPRCGAAGTLVLGYGPLATEEDGAVLLALESPPPSPDDVDPAPDPRTPPLPPVPPPAPRAE